MRLNTFRAALATAALMMVIAIAGAPQAKAGVLWAGLGYPINYYYNPYAIVAEPTLVYAPYYYYFSGYPYYGYARDTTYFAGFSPYYTNPWVWGFWDAPPDQGNPNQTIRYDEVFAAQDASGNPTGLQGLSVTADTLAGNLTGNTYTATVTQGTFSQLASMVDPTNVSNLQQYFGSAMTNDPNGTVYVASFTGVPISDIAEKAPEPGTYLIAGSALLGLAAVLRRRRTAGT